MVLMNRNGILLVKGCAGLGNRILCLLTAFLYARLTKRLLVVDWSDPIYSSGGSNIFDRFFQCKVSGSMTELPDTDSIAPRIWRNHLRDSVRDMRRHYAPESAWHPGTWSKFSIDLSRLDHPEDVLVMWSYFEQVRVLRRHFTGAFARLRDRDTKAILREGLEGNLRLNPLVQERVDRFKNDWFHGRTVGVHIRYTDKRSRMKAICRKLDGLLKQDPGAQIFLATDNVDVEKMFQSEYSRVTAIPKSYPAPGIAIHRSPALSDRVEHGIEALVDMHLLAECDCLVLDESSSFAYVASLLTRRPGVRVYNLQRGHRIPPDVRYWIWAFRQRLEAHLRKGRRDRRRDRGSS